MATFFQLQRLNCIPDLQEIYLSRSNRKTVESRLPIRRKPDSFRRHCSAKKYRNRWTEKCTMAFIVDKLRIVKQIVFAKTAATKQYFHSLRIKES